jgi:RNA polymerase-binding transcription factor DksA
MFDCAQAIAGVETHSMNRDRLLRTAQQLRDTLCRIAAGTHGICEKCDEPIAAARLRALPTAGLCISCQTKEEIRARAAAAR